MVRILRVFTKFSGLLMAFPIAYVMVFMAQVIGVWIGDGYEAIYPILSVMLPIEVAVCAVNSLIEVPIVCEKLRAVALVTVILGVTNVLLSIFMLCLTDWGVIGVCISWVISMGLLKMVFYPIYSSTLTSGSKGRYFPAIVYSLGAFVILTMIGFAVSSFITMPTSWTAIFISFVPGFLIYFIIAMRFLFNRDERSLVKTFLPGFVQRFIHD